MRMDREQIRKIIPHRPQCCWLIQWKLWRRAATLSPGFMLRRTGESLRAIFLGAPVLPGIYTVECMGQAADILLLSCARYAGTTPYLIGIDNIRFISKVAPGDMLEVHATISSERQEKGIVACTAEVYNLSANNQVCCTGEVILAMR